MEYRLVTETLLPKFIQNLVPYPEGYEVCFSLYFPEGKLWTRCQFIAVLSPALKFIAPNLYTWVERSIARVLLQCLTQEHKLMTPAKAHTRTVQSGVQCTDH